MSAPGTARVAPPCPVCHAPVGPWAAQCSHCGALAWGVCPRVEADPAQAVETAPLSRDVRLEELGGGENRPLTILFVDVAGSFQATGSMSGEECAAFMTPILATMIDTIVAHGGRVGRCLGDGLLAYFGTPLVREDDCDRAILATLDIQHALRQRGFEITAGIHYGTVYLGWIGSHQYRELTVMGAIVDIAARLQSKATPGQILVSHAAVQRARQSHTFTPVSIPLKGIREPALAYVCSREHVVRQSR